MLAQCGTFLINSRFRSHWRLRSERSEFDSQDLVLRRRLADLRHRTHSSAIGRDLLLGQRSLLDLRLSHWNLRWHYSHRDGRYVGRGSPHKLLRHLAVRQRNSPASRSADLSVDLRAHQRLSADLLRARFVPSRRLLAVELHAVRSAKKGSCCRRRRCRSSRCIGLSIHQSSLPPEPITIKMYTNKSSL